MGRRRQYVGAVRGGNPGVTLPAGSFNINMAGIHAVGRVQAMQEELVQVAYLKSRGVIPNGVANASFQSNVTLDGADFQDFEGVQGAPYVMAHRAVGTIHVGGRNVADFVAPWSDYAAKGDPLTRPTLLHHIVAPQARTDPLPWYSNYADGYLERVLNNPVTLLFQRILGIQRASQPLEKAALVDALGEMSELIAAGYGLAIGEHQARRAEKGFVEGAVLPPGAEVDIDAAIDNAVSNLRVMTKADEAPQPFLAVSCEAARHQAPAATEASVSDLVAQLDDAGRSR